MDESEHMIVIDSERYEIEEVFDGSYLPLLIIGNRDYYVAENPEEAGKAARQYWQDMVENDPEEFKCIVGVEALVAWALGQSYAPGTLGVRSLDEWLDLHLDAPEENFASYDGEELEVSTVSPALIDDLGFTPTVAYRHN